MYWLVVGLTIFYTAAQPIAALRRYKTYFSKYVFAALLFFSSHLLSSVVLGDSNFDSKSSLGDFFNSVVTQIKNANQELGGEKYLYSPEVEITNDLQPNLHSTFSFPKGGERELAQKIQLSRGFFDGLLRESSGHENIQRGLHLSVGAIALEVAKATLAIKSGAIPQALPQSSSAKLTAEQIIRADLLATQFLRHSNLPIDAVYEYLSFKKNNSKNQNPNPSATNSSSQTDLRLTALRLSIGTSLFEFGDNGIKNIKISTNEEGFLLQEHTAQMQQLQMQPTQLNEAVDKFTDTNDAKPLIDKFQLLARLPDLLKAKVFNTSIRDELIRKIPTAKLNVIKRMVLFKIFTIVPPTTNTDYFFQTQIEPYLGDPRLNPEQKRKLLEAILKQNKLLSDRLISPLAKQLVFHKYSQPKTEAEIKEAFAYLQELMPTPSQGKDKILEALGWKFQLSGQNLKNLVEDQKSKNVDQVKLNAEKFFFLKSEVVSHFSSESKFEILRYLQDPLEANFRPKPIRQELYQNLLADLAKAEGGGRVTAEVNYKAKFLIEKLQLFAYQSEPMQRIPVIDYLLTSSQAPLIQDSGFRDKILRELLNIKPGTIEEASLAAYLDISRPAYLSLVYSYLLSQKASGSAGIAQRFEVFQAVGKKFGQLSSIWKIFGEEVAKESKHLKNNAEALSLYEIQEIVNSTLTKEQRSHIKKYIRILGAASMKTVVLVELTNGEFGALMVQGKNNPAQIESGLRLGKQYIEAFSRYKFFGTSVLFSTLIEALEQQMRDEVRMKLEAEKQKQAKILIEKINQEMATELQGWQFEAPTIYEATGIYDNVYISSVANGQSYDELNEMDKMVTGELIVKMKMKMFFHHGWLEPDRHTGNWIIDVKSKKIRMIDFGQLQNFSAEEAWTKWDARLTLAGFLQAISEKKAADIVRYGNQMKKDERVFDKLAMQNKIQSVLDKNLELSDLLTEIVQSFSEQGVSFDKIYSFGALKGLMVLYGERYVTDEKFREIVKTELVSLYKSKIGAVVGENIQKYFEKKEEKKNNSKPKEAVSLIQESAAKESITKFSTTSTVRCERVLSH